jgi:hypothetical protein
LQILGYGWKVVPAFDGGPISGNACQLSRSMQHHLLSNRLCSVQEKRTIREKVCRIGNRDWRNTVRKMRMSILLFLVGLFAISAPVFAHHGNASYDYAKTITLKGTVTQWLWSNPHCLLKFDVKDDKGEAQHWVTEASSPVDMLRIGWTSNIVKAGDEITIDVMPSKSGVSVGRIRQVTLSDGTILKATTRYGI